MTLTISLIFLPIFFLAFALAGVVLAVHGSIYHATGKLLAGILMVAVGITGLEASKIASEHAYGIRKYELIENPDGSKTWQRVKVQPVESP